MIASSSIRPPRRNLRPLRAGLLYLAYLVIVALGLYETTAKAPELLGLDLPLSRTGVRAEHDTAWQAHTGVLPLDRLLHESEEAVRFYSYLLNDHRPVRPPLAATAGLGG